MRSGRASALRSGWLGRQLAAACLSACLAVPAWADVWGFVDEKGVAHFAAQQLDERYELFFRNAESFDTRLDPAAPDPVQDAAPAPVVVPITPSKLIAFFDNSPTFKQLKSHLREASSDHNIDYELLQALIATESGFDAGAVSVKGAIGLMQIMPDTARRYGVEGDRKLALAQKLTDPRINIKTGTRYLRDLINMFPGQLELALAAYNAGEGAVMRAGNQIPNYKETQNYVKTILQLYAALKPPAPPVPTRPTLSRVRPTIKSSAPVIRGGAANRGNMPVSATADAKARTETE